MSPEAAVVTDGRPKTLVGAWLDSLGFWLFLCMLEGFAWTVWTLLEIQNHYYFATTPFSATGTMIPW